MAEEKGRLSVREAGRRGGEATQRNNGPEFYRKIGKMGGDRVRKLIQAGKEQEKADGADR